MPGWGVSYFGNRFSGHADADMAEIAASGFDSVVHTFSENDLFFCTETMKKIVEISHGHGLTVFLDPWGVGGVFGGEAFSRHLLDSPDIWQVSRSGRRKPAACLNHPAFRTFMLEWLERAADIEPDGIFWDEPHWSPTTAEDGMVCMCDCCRRRYGDLYGGDLLHARDGELELFRQCSKRDFLEYLCSRSNARKLKNNVCLLPIWDGREEGADWEGIASLECVDIISTDPYWFHFGKDIGSFVTVYSRRIRKLAEIHGKEGQIWIQSFRVPPGREEEIAEAIDAALDAGISGIAFWGFRACENMSYLDNGNAANIWRVICESMRKRSNARGTETG